MKYQLVNQNNALEKLCTRLSTKSAISIDTEFIRIRTYYPKIGLIQLFDGEILALIDPLTISDWGCFEAVLQNKSQQKYFHACSEDIDVFKHKFTCIPEPLWDSQILAAFLDNGLSTSYANLVLKYLNVTLTKSETLTNWLVRPLSEKQLHYAAADVYYHLPLMNELIDRVKAKGWREAAKEECHSMVLKKLDTITPEKAYLSIKNVSQLKGPQLNRLQRLASWRLNYARQHDIAVNFVVPEILLWKIARCNPTSLAELKALGMHGKEIRLYASIILALLKQPIQNVLPPVKIPIDYGNYKIMAKHLKESVSKIAGETGLDESILLSRRHINHYVEWINGTNTTTIPEIVSGWRAPLFHAYLEK